MSGGGAGPLLLLTSPLGDDTLPFEEGTLHAIAVDAREAISTPFVFDLTCVSTDRSVVPDELLAQPVAVTIRRKDGIDRFLHGMVRRMEAVGLAQRGRWEYRLELVPRLWFLAESTDCRIFQDKTAVEILRVLFADHGVQPVEFRIFGDMPTREYTTQFNETGLEFAHRLMQESGYFYFFEHSKSEHTLVVTDANQSFPSMQRPTHRVVHNGDNVDIFDRWAISSRVVGSRVQLQDYDPTRPAAPVNGERAASRGTPGPAARDVYRWPAMTTENQVAADRARFRMQADEAEAALRAGHGYDPLLCPGYRFTLEWDPFGGAGGDLEHAVHSVSHRAADETWIGGTQPPRYDCDFTCFEQSVAWRNRLTAARPAMSGIFSAIVLGEEGEEIHADRLARIKVRPKFDHRNETVAAMAIWVRILNAWAGNRWGWQHLPRVGTEVGLSFMNGDPDNPVVVGGFYHEENPPMFDVDDAQERTRQGFRSRSTLHGGPQEYSELSFKDFRGNEEVFLQAQRDLVARVKRDETRTIGKDRSVTTAVDDSLTSTRGDITITAELGSVTISAATRITLQVGATSITLSEAGISMTTPSMLTGKVGGVFSIVAGGEASIVAGGDANLTGVGVVTIESVAEVAITSVAGDINLLGGEVSIEAYDGPIAAVPAVVVP